MAQTPRLETEVQRVAQRLAPSPLPAAQRCSLVAAGQCLPFSRLAIPHSWSFGVTILSSSSMTSPGVYGAPTLRGPGI